MNKITNAAVASSYDNKVNAFNYRLDLYITLDSQ